MLPSWERRASLSWLNERREEKMTEGWKNIIVPLSVQIYEKLKELSRATGTPMTQIIRTVILEFLKKAEQEKEVKR
jgi:hypothetical protein